VAPEESAPLAWLLIIEVAWVLLASVLWAVFRVRRWRWTGEDLEVGRFVGLVIGVGLVIAALFMAVAQT
jgi:hypothetical protein